jgi:hypothetical protein
MPLVDRYLQHPPREPGYRQGRPHTEFMGSLGSLCSIDMDGNFLQQLNLKLNSRLADLADFYDK